MKIIDNRGKLFGIVNIIDLSVILILLLMVVGGYKVLSSKPEMISQNQKVLINLEVQEIRQPSVDAIKEGDNLYHYDRGQLLGKIKKVKIDNYKEEVSTQDGEIILSDVPGKYVANIIVEADAVITDDVIIIGGMHTRVGTQYRVKNKNIAMFVTVLKVDVIE